MSELLLTMSVPELAERVGVDTSTAYRYLRAGQLPGVQAGNSWLIDRGRVERFVAGLEDAQGRPLVHAPPPPDAPVLTLLPEREGLLPPVGRGRWEGELATAELARSWLRGARAAFEMLFAAAELQESETAATDRQTVSA